MSVREVPADRTPGAVGPPGEPSRRPPSQTRQGGEYAQLVRDLTPELRRHVRAAADDTQDVLAETFLVVWRRWDHLPADPDERRAWIFATARRTLQTHHRGARRRRRLLTRLAMQRTPTSTPPPSEHHDAREATTELLSRLPADQRVAVRLVVLDGLSIAEAAAELDISITALTSRLHRARLTLRRALDQTTEAGS